MHGQQFRARFVRTAAPTSTDGIERYLASGMIRGIGPVYAKKLVKAFGEKVFDIIEGSPERLNEIAGIGKVRARRITDAWAEQKIVREIMVFLVWTGGRQCDCDASFQLLDTHGDFQKRSANGFESGGAPARALWSSPTQ